MSNILDAQYKTVMRQEELFAKRVVYHMRANSPPPWWHHIIPFRFMWEIIARNKDLRNFSSKHLRLKEMALSAACNGVKKNDLDRGRREMQAQLRDFWAHENQPEYQELYRLLSQWLDLLYRHYCRLLQTGQKDYGSMTRQAYDSAEKYEQFLSELLEVEKKVDRAVLDFTGLEKVSYIKNKQKAIQAVRDREMRELCLE